MAARKKALTKRKSSTALAKPSGALAEQLNRQRATIKAATFDSVKIQSRNFLVNDVDLGKEIYAVVLENVFEHRWFAGEYDPDIVASPDCFALSQNEDDMVPHANSVEKQGDDCPTCPMNKYGSGRGNAKACQNRVRLMLLPQAEANAEDIDDAETFTLYVSPKSIKNFREYASMLFNKLEVSTAMVITKITAEPEEKQGNYSILSFEYEEPLPINAKFQKQLESKIKTSTDAMLSPYEQSTKEDTPKKGRRASTKKKSTRRKSRLS